MMPRLIQGTRASAAFVLAALFAGACAPRPAAAPGSSGEATTRRSERDQLERQLEQQRSERQQLEKQLEAKERSTTSPAEESPPSDHSAPAQCAPGDPLCDEGGEWPGKSGSAGPQPAAAAPAHASAPAPEPPAAEPSEPKRRHGDEGKMGKRELKPRAAVVHDEAVSGDVLAYIQAHVRPAASCVPDGSTGAIDVRASIGGGRLSHAQVLSAAPLPPAVESCILDVVAKVRVPSDAPARVIVVRVLDPQ